MSYRRMGLFRIARPGQFASEQSQMDFVLLFEKPLLVLLYQGNIFKLETLSE